MYTKAQVKAWMDAIFVGIEAKAALAPWGLGPAFAASLAALQAQADSHFDAVYAQLQADATLGADSFFNALQATFGSNPLAALAIALAKQFVDAQLAARALNAAAA